MRGGGTPEGGLMKFCTFVESLDLIKCANFHVYLMINLRARWGSKISFSLEMHMALTTLPCASALASDIAVRKWTGSGFGHTVTSQRVDFDAIRQICLGFLQAINACRPRISHRYRDIAVPRWTGSGFGHTVTSHSETDAAIR
jgi:hypothetical protein